MTLQQTAIENLGCYFEHFETQSAFSYYEAVRGALPQAEFPQTSMQADNLAALADRFDVFVFDAFGVLNVGTTAIDGAASSVEHLRALEKSVFVLTNGATFPLDHSVEKFKRLGVPFKEQEIITSRMAASNHVNASGLTRWGVMGKTDSDPAEFSVETRLLDDNRETYDWAQAFLLLTTWEWNAARQLLLEEAIKQNPRPVVVANPDVIAPLERRFSTEPGFVGHRLSVVHGASVAFHGKPFASVFDLVMARLPQGQDRKRIAMIGDTLHTDVLGGAAAGWGTVLVTQHGLFRGSDVSSYIEASQIRPDYIIPSI